MSVFQAHILAVVTAAVFSRSAVAGDSPVVIAERGRISAYAIVLPERATPSQEYAAAELQEWTEKLTGVRLQMTRRSRRPAVFLNACEEYGDDGFRISVDDGRNVVISGGRRGVLYGVYELLETYGGVGWFSQERTFVPNAERLAVPADLDDIQKPAFAVRETTWVHGEPESVRRFAARMRMNGTDSMADARRGGRGIEFLPEFGRCHTFHLLIPPEEFFAEHPEYFSEVGGVRRNGHTQLCLTNPDVAELAARKVVDAFRKHPESTAYGVSYSDWGNYCECANCSAVNKEEASECGTLIRFCNAVAEHVSRVVPGKTCVTQLADDHRKGMTKVPRFVRPRHDVMPCLCTIDCDYADPIGDSEHPANKKFAGALTQWKTISERLYLWDYTSNYAFRFHVFPNLRVMQPNMRFFRENGVSALFEEGASRYADFADLKGWLLMKWMWNPDAPLEKLLERFLSGYYGKAAPFARECLQIDNDAIADKSKPRRMLGIFDEDRPWIYTDDMVRRKLALWEEGEKAVSEDPGALFNVQLGKAVCVATLLDRAAATAKYVWATRHPERFSKPSDVGVLYGWMTNWMQTAEKRTGHPVRFNAMESRHRKVIDGWAMAAAFERPDHGRDRAVICADLLYGDEHRIGRIVDISGMFGESIRLKTDTDARAVTFSVGNIAYDAEGRYRLRIHAKVVPAVNGCGEAFRAGVVGDGGMVLERGWDVGKTSPSYRWYDVGFFAPSDDKTIWIASGKFSKGGGAAAVSSVCIDMIEVVRDDKSDIRPADGSIVSQLNEKQRAYMDGSIAKRMVYFKRDPMNDTSPELRSISSSLNTLTGFPVPVRFVWPKSNERCFEFALYRDGCAEPVCKRLTRDGCTEVTNLEISCSYHWTVNGLHVGRFATEAQAPRLINIPGLCNVRDLGGRVGLTGRRVKQGLIYRSAGLNDNAKITYYTPEECLALEKEGRLSSMGRIGELLSKDIQAGKKLNKNYIRLVKKYPDKPGRSRLTPESCKAALSEFGFKTDIDLRMDWECFAMTQSPLGPQVSWRQFADYGKGVYVNVVSDVGKKLNGEIFRVLLDPANYPIIFHCIGGADRTGTLAYLLNGLLGVPDDELRKDWELTGWHGGVEDALHMGWFTNMETRVKAEYKGVSSGERFRNYYRSTGISDDEISAFREFMLEEKTDKLEVGAETL